MISPKITKPLTLVFTLTLMACAPKVPAKKAAGPLAEAMCQKLAECMPGTTPQSTQACAASLKATYPAAMKAFGNAEVKEEDLNNCLKTIKEQSCKNLTIIPMPAACPFIDYPK